MADRANHADFWSLFEQVLGACYAAYQLFIKVTAPSIAIISMLGFFGMKLEDGTVMSLFVKI